MCRWITFVLVAGTVYPQVRIPRVWEERGFQGWNTPIANQSFAAGHFTEQEYYAAPLDNLRTYPVYYPGREPKGFWEFLNTVGPKPLIEPEKLKTEADWIEAGRRTFDELDFSAAPHSRLLCR